jgi:glutamyl-tRNA(Gln) amidotransferase subunit E
MHEGSETVAPAPDDTLMPGFRPPSDLNPRRDAPLDFPDREFGELTPDDYRVLGFMSGLEVHQQLRTAGKLFCRCPAGRRVTKVDGEVLRHMRPTLSELGEYDGTALMEFKTKKEIVYLLERGSVCTYEMDDTPPFPVDGEAVRVAIEVALLFNLQLVSELHVMRKQYLDGSIPTGFQRTAMVGLAGAIPFRVPELGVDKALRVRQLSLEEDSCREVTDIGHRIVFRTDRLGTPLTETVTEPDLLTPFEVQAGGRLIAATVGSTGKVVRGAGAARQDTNVSIAGSRRIELKGVPSHRILPRLVHVEAFRQLNLLKIRAELQERGVTKALLGVPGKGLPWIESPLVLEATGALRGCNFPPVRDAMEKGETIAALRLPRFGRLLDRRTQPGITFAREFADRVRVIACLAGRPFMLDSDAEDGLRPAEWRELRTALRADPWDAIVVVWGSREDVATAVREVFLRAQDALDGVPSETRQAHADGTNGFERILPGPDRMYPDTDTPPVAIADTTVEEIRAARPERPWERTARYEALGLDEPASRRLASATWAALFDALEPRTTVSARRLAAALEKRLPFHARTTGRPIPPPDRLRPLVEALEAGALRPEVFERAIDALLENPELPPEVVIAEFRPGPRDDADLDGLVRRTVDESAVLAGRSLPAMLRWAMGRVMPDLLGRLPPQLVRERLEQALAAVHGGAA